MAEWNYVACATRRRRRILRSRILFSSYKKLRFYTIKTLCEDCTAAEWKYVAYATRRRLKNPAKQDSCFNRIIKQEEHENDSI